MDRASFSTLPVLALDPAAPSTYRIEPDGVTRLVGQVLAGSSVIGRPDRGDRVLVIDGVGSPQVERGVRKRVTEQGFVFVDARPAASPGRKETIIVVFDTSSRSNVRASQLASALGLPQAKVEVSLRTQNIADLVVLVGSDFKP